MFHRFASTWLVLLCFPAILPAEELTLLDLIPENAIVGLGIRNIRDLEKKGDKFIDDTNWQLPIRPSAAFRQAYNFLGIKQGESNDGPAAIMIANPEDCGGVPGGWFGILKLAVIAIPFDDLDKMAGNFGYEKGKLKRDVIVESLDPKEMARFVLVHGRHVFLADSKAPLTSVRKSAGLKTFLTPAQQKTFNAADILVHVSTHHWGNDWTLAIRNFEEYLRNHRYFADKDFEKQCVEAVKATRFLLTSLQIEDGLRMRSAVVFDRGSKPAKDFLTALQGGKGSSDLHGLPEGPVILAQGSRGDGSKTDFIGRMILDFLREFGVTQNPFAQTDQKIFLGILEEFWHRLKGERLAVYQNADRQKFGLFSMVMILDPENPKEFLAQLKQIARFAQVKGFRFPAIGNEKEEEIDLARLVRDLADNRYRVRQAATLKLMLLGEPVLPHLEKAVNSDDAEVQNRARKIRDAILEDVRERRAQALTKTVDPLVRPKFTFAEKSILRNGYELETLLVGLPESDTISEKRMKTLFGPQWGQIRMVRSGDRIVLLLGSDEKLLFETVKNLELNKPGLAATPFAAEFRKHFGTGGKLELHVSSEAWVRLLEVADLKEVAPLKATEMSSLSVAVEPDQLQLDVWIPTREFRELLKVEANRFP